MFISTLNCFIYYGGLIPFIGIIFSLLYLTINTKNNKIILTLIQSLILFFLIAISQYVLRVVPLTHRFGLLKKTWFTKHFIFENVDFSTAFYQNIQFFFGNSLIYNSILITSILVSFGLVFKKNRSDCYLVIFSAASLATIFVLSYLKYYPYAGTRHTFVILPSFLVCITLLIKTLLSDISTNSLRKTFVTLVLLLGLNGIVYVYFSKLKISNFPHKHLEQSLKISQVKNIYLTLKKQQITDLIRSQEGALNFAPVELKIGQRLKIRKHKINYHDTKAFYSDSNFFKEKNQLVKKLTGIGKFGALYRCSPMGWYEYHKTPIIHWKNPVGENAWCLEIFNQNH